MNRAETETARKEKAARCFSPADVREWQRTLDFFSFLAGAAAATGAGAATSFFSFLEDLSDFPIASECVRGRKRGG